MADITMSVDEVLELDYLVQDRNPDPISLNEDPSDYNLSGFETRTGVFEPNRTGNYTMNINGRTYEIKVVDIPDSVIHQYNALELSASDGETIDVWPDEVGNADVSGSETYLSSGINSNPAIEFGSGGFDISDSGISDVTQPLTIISVCNAPVDQGISRSVVENTVSGSNLKAQHGGDAAGTPGWRFYAGENFLGGTDDNSTQLFTAIFDGNNSEIRENGTQTLTGDPGPDNLNQLSIGPDWDSEIGFIEIHDGRPSNGIATREQEVADLWDITI